MVGVVALCGCVWAWSGRGGRGGRCGFLGFVFGLVFGLIQGFFGDGDDEAKVDVSDIVSPRAVSAGVGREKGREFGAYAAPRMRSRMRSCPGKCQRVRSAAIEGTGHVDVLVAIACVVSAIHKELLHFHEVWVDDCSMCAWQSEAATTEQ